MTAPSIIELKNFRLLASESRQSQFTHRQPQKPFYFSPETGTVLPPLPQFKLLDDEITTVDLGGHYLAPGFLEVQINGLVGVHFSTLGRGGQRGDGRIADESELHQVARELVKHGVTAWWATVPTVEAGRWKQILPLLKPREFEGGATLLGAHVEGPYLHPSRKGAHDATFFKTALDVTPLELYGHENLRDVIKLITLAPELPGALDLIRLLRKDYPHIIISMGHSTATYEQGQAALEAGAHGLTHVFNAMDGLHHRQPGLVGLISNNKSLALIQDETVSPGEQLLSSNMSAEKWLARQMKNLDPNAESEGNRSPEVFFSIIPDLVHVHPAVLSMVFRSAPDHCVLITDAIELAGLQDGTYPPNDQITSEQLKQGHRATKVDTDTLIGSCVTLDACVRNMVQHGGCSLAESVACVTANAGRYLGEDRRGRGSLGTGTRADFVVLDKEGNVKQTWVGGVQVWNDSRDCG